MYYLQDVKYKGIVNISRLSIESGKITSIIGESGSGKTTLLKLLNKLISPDGGKIFFRNRPLEEFNSVQLRREVVMLPQVPAMFPGTVKDNLLIGLKFAEKPIPPNEVLDKLIQLIHLNKNLNDDAEKLSGGEKQRLALGRVILIEPDVLLLDEPSSALDEETEQIIIEKLVRYTRDNQKTLIMVTHSKKIAGEFSDKVVEIKAGRIVNGKEVFADGQPD